MFILIIKAGTETCNPGRSGVRMNSAMYRDHGIRWWTDEKVPNVEHGMLPSYRID